MFSFKDLYVVYMKDCETRLKSTTIDNKMNVIEHQLLPYFGETQIDKIDSAMVRRWQNEIISKGYKSTYQKTIHNQLSAMFNYAVDFHKLKSNPARKAKSIGSKKSDSEMKIWTPNQFRTFVYYFVEDFQMRAAFNILFWTGIRSGELLAYLLKI
ncbi:hypothetical protein AN1V17_08270 [Vallitalea sediminicola]